MGQVVGLFLHSSFHWTNMCFNKISFGDNLGCICYLLLKPRYKKTLTCYTVKLGNKERFDKEQIGIKKPFPVTNLNLLHKDKDLLALRNNFRATKKFLIAKFDCI